MSRCFFLFYFFSLFHTFSSQSLMNLGDVSYVVEIHSNADVFAESEHASKLELSEKVEMTARNGKRFTCYLPAAQDSQDKLNDDILERSRDASKGITSCLVWPLSDHQSYELCPSIAVRQISKEEITNLGDFKSDVLGEIKPFSENEKDLSDYAKDALDQIQDRSKVFTESFENNIMAQYLCGEKDEIVNLKKSETGELLFLVLSPLFCESNLNQAGDDIQKYLEPMVTNGICIKKKEGWWTYEFCFGKELRQFHAEQNGEIHAEFSLGKFDKAVNDKREKQGQSITVDYIDGTNDDARTVYVQHFFGGSPCEETAKARRTEVYIYCNPMATMHYIHSVKETQTCVYTIKISTPVICSHPKFAKDESRAKENSLAVHCIPSQQDTP